MNFIDFKTSFDTFMGVKTNPNDHEKELFERAKKYISKITWIPGLRMVAVVNSLSMYATDKDSDIDLFIITAKNRIWIVRVCVTLVFWISGVWRKGKDIAGNFCLSFFITEDAMDLEKIAIEEDIYLYFWIYHMKPILSYEDTYEKFLLANPWVDIDQGQKIQNMQYKIQSTKHQAQSRDYGEDKTNFGDIFEQVLRYFSEKKARRSFQKKGSPPGVIITKDMLKFHDQDRRREIRDACLSMGEVRR